MSTNLRDRLYQGDLPIDVYETLSESQYLALDTETLGLNPKRDRLCLVQMCNERGDLAFVQVDMHHPNRAVWLRRLLVEDKPQKLIHYARFDMGMLYEYLGVMPSNVYCTKVASKIARTFSGSHGLKDLVWDLLGVTLDKEKQTSYWGSSELSDEQLQYAANDVIHLIPLKEQLDFILQREGRSDLIPAAMAALPTIVRLDLAGYSDIFTH